MLSILGMFGQGPTLDPKFSPEGKPVTHDYTDASFNADEHRLPFKQGFRDIIGGGQGANLNAQYYLNNQDATNRFNLQSQMAQLEAAENLKRLQTQNEMMADRDFINSQRAMGLEQTQGENRQRELIFKMLTERGIVPTEETIAQYLQATTRPTIAAQGNLANQQEVLTGQDLNTFQTPLYQGARSEGLTAQVRAPVYQNFKNSFQTIGQGDAAFDIQGRGIRNIPPTKSIIGMSDLGTPIESATPGSLKPMFRAPNGMLLTIDPSSLVSNSKAPISSNPLNDAPVELEDTEMMTNSGAKIKPVRKPVASTVPQFNTINNPFSNYLTRRRPMTNDPSIY